jgi:Domain of unknown function (DUF222)/HNH endonuclease
MFVVSLESQLAIVRVFYYSDGMEFGAADAIGNPVEDALDQLSTGLDHLIKLVEDGGLDQVDDAGLVGFLQGFERFRNRLSLIDHVGIAGLVARDLPTKLCQGSARRVLASALRISKSEAARRVRAAEAVGPRTSMLGESLDPVRPHLAAAQRDGEVSAEQVAIIERAITPVDRRGFDPADIAAGEQLLIAHARSFGPEDLRQLADRVVDAIDPDGTLPNEELNADRRFLQLRPTKDGAWTGEFRLTGAAGAKLKALLDPLAVPRVCPPDHAEPAAEGSPMMKLSPLHDIDTRHHGQRLRDALEELCDRLLQAGDTVPTGGVPATVIVTIDLDDLRNRCGYGRSVDGTLIPTTTLLEIANQAEIIPAVLNAAGAVLDLGRSRRIATHTQTLALTARDGGCSFPGCDRAPQWCERHHIQEWIDGGSTDIGNLTLLCRYHHHNFAARGWQCRINTDGLPEWTPPKWIDRTQTPLINTRIRGGLVARKHARNRHPSRT